MAPFFEPTILRRAGAFLTWVFGEKSPLHYVKNPLLGYNLERQRNVRRDARLAINILSVDKSSSYGIGPLDITQ